MDILIYLIPIALLLGLIGLGGFIWSMKSNQYEDMDGAAHRILLDDDENTPKKP
jgi:cbb3-type cytochrome oxidase maturation protein